MSAYPGPDPFPLWVNLLVAAIGVALVAVPVYRDWRRRRDAKRRVIRRLTDR